MGRKLVSKDTLKIKLTIRIRSDLVKKLKEIKGYNNLIESLIDEHFKKVETKDK